jgi:hypothetical protein
MESYSTLVDAINGLRVKGYTVDFNLKGKYQLTPEDFKVDDVFRFEGESDPEDQTVLYAISSEKYKIKGLLVNAYGVYSDPEVNELIKKLKVHEEQ